MSEWGIKFFYLKKNVWLVFSATISHNTFHILTEAFYWYNCNWGRHMVRGTTRTNYWNVLHPFHVSIKVTLTDIIVFQMKA